ncbi:MAG: hypothetical protein DMF64_00700, partial [Acidobacteria bacterium]
MRVLPGMQSAFVDIGLERDAFLYVSDFFDEEEEFERIVVDKSKTESAEAARAHAAERIERARIERERQIETAQERVEPSSDTEAEATEAATIDEEETLAAPELVAAPQPVASAEEAETGGRRGRRRRGRGGRDTQAELEETAPRATAAGSESASIGIEADRQPRVGAGVAADTPFVVGGGEFERIVDEDEAAFGEGEMFKDARLQERITDQIRGGEFDFDEAAQDITVGTLLAANNLSGGASFERVADEESDDATPREVKKVQPAVAASIVSLTDSVLDEAPTATGAPQAFERVSDDEKAVEALPATKGKATRTRGGVKGKKSAATEADATEEAAPKRKRASATKGASKKASKKSASKGTAGKGRATKRGKAATEETNATSATEGGASADESFADADASVKVSPTRGEFARRGGRRRNRRPKPGENGAEEHGNGHAEAVEETVAPPEPAHVEEAPPPARSSRSSRTDSRRGAGGRGHVSRSESSHADGGRGRVGRSEGRNEGRNVVRSDSRRSESGRSDAGRGRGRDRGTPMITDLLREGQEILVQIAKEPIAAKGARITSHIALPGRFLVYMPTIEHVGVSRKIESDSERQRLRKLIKDIRETEEVPSGGFIVRTAGVGISEQDLRDDAR